MESLTAATLLSIAGAAAFMTLNWVIQSNKMPLEIQADASLRQLAAETRHQQRYIDETVAWKSWTVHRKVEPIPEKPGFFQLHLQALDANGRLISTYSELIYAP